MISTIVVSAIAVVVSLGLLGGGAAALFVYLKRNLSDGKPAGQAPEAVMAGYGMRLAELEITVKGLPSLWEEERKRADRAADSARKARASAEEKLAEVEEIIEANEGVPGLDEPAELELQLQPMRANMGVPAEAGLQERVAAVAHLMR